MTFAAPVSAAELGGHTKLRIVGQSYPNNSLFRDIAGSTSVDAVGELRLNFSTRRSGWASHADYQLLGVASEFLPLGLPGDDRRLMDLTKVVDDGADTALLHRLDRLWVGFAGEKFVVRAGRQALTWGNGLYFTPMDLVNPFDPTTIDTEYKTGDDMLYAQVLRSNGDDVQLAAVFRRDPATGDVEGGSGTVAVKYHGFSGAWEYDVLFAEDVDEAVFGFGLAGSIGGAVWRGDVVVTDEPGDTRVELVTNVSYSWLWRERNVSGSGEYYFDGDDRHYLAGSLAIELSPLWTLSPTLISNIDDPSALLQVVTRYSLGDNIEFIGSLNLPLGADGTEYAGAEVPPTGRYLSFDAGIFAQLAWYF